MDNRTKTNLGVAHSSQLVSLPVLQVCTTDASVLQHGSLTGNAEGHLPCRVEQNGHIADGEASEPSHRARVLAHCEGLNVGHEE
jgi:hypothetical protein